MKVLFIGDVFGRSGRDSLETYLPGLKDEYKPDLIIVNGENAAHGRGITPNIADAFFDMGTHCITTGNHVWDQREIFPYIEKNQNLLRPVNLPNGTPGKGVWENVLDDGRRIVVINVMTRLFMELSDDPFAALEAVLKNYRLGQNAQMIFIDCHGEATSEKYALAHHFDGRISGFIGTHTHVPTADHHIMAGGTAYQTDTGMTGCYNSVIGVQKQSAIKRFMKKVPGEKFNPADEEATLCGIFIVTSDTSGLATSVEPLRLGGILSQTH